MLLVYYLKYSSCYLLKLIYIFYNWQNRDHLSGNIVRKMFCLVVQMKFIYLAFQNVSKDTSEILTLMHAHPAPKEPLPQLSTMMLNALPVLLELQPHRKEVIIATQVSVRYFPHSVYF